MQYVTIAPESVLESACGCLYDIIESFLSDVIGSASTMLGDFSLCTENSSQNLITCCSVHGLATSVCIKVCAEPAFAIQLF